jgi:hypothetical protein
MDVWILGAMETHTELDTGLTQSIRRQLSPVVVLYPNDSTKS